jgi:hypothetical protein
MGSVNLELALSPDLRPTPAGLPRQGLAGQALSDALVAAGFAALMQTTPQAEARAPRSEAGAPRDEAPALHERQAGLVSGSPSSPLAWAVGTATLQGAPPAPVRLPDLSALAPASTGERSLPGNELTMAPAAGAAVSTNVSIPADPASDSEIDGSALPTIQEVPADPATAVIDASRVDPAESTPRDESAAKRPAIQVFAPAPKMSTGETPR